MVINEYGDYIEGYVSFEDLVMSELSEIGRVVKIKDNVFRVGGLPTEEGLHGVADYHELAVIQNLRNLLCEYNILTRVNWNTTGTELTIILIEKYMG